MLTQLCMHSPLLRVQQKSNPRKHQWLSRSICKVRLGCAPMISICRKSPRNEVAVKSSCNGGFNRLGCYCFSWKHQEQFPKKSTIFSMYFGEDKPFPKFCNGSG